ncbi:MAG: alcohol dehydrogenase catalytic domain-containing protein [Actinobacteria bacterium]|nr:alcohol dehydrogenase catalytic domain-containing protein [Actinomycetota bacterium]
MKVGVLRAPHTIEVVETPVPEPSADEVLVRVANCGVCASEVDMWEGRSEIDFPRYVGHEVSGVVERVGARVRSLHPGDPVAAWVTSHGFAEYVAVKEEHCVRASGVPLALALAEPLACAVNAVELAAPALGDDVLVIGAGFMGNLVQKLVQLKGPRHVIVADTRRDAVERARRIGATEVVDVKAGSLKRAVADVTEKRGVDVAFEVTGMQAPLDVLGDVTRMSGKVAIVGYHQGGRRQLPLAQWNYKAFEIVNAHFREITTIMRGMRAGMRLLTSGRLSLEDLVSHSFALEEIDRAFELAFEKPEDFVKATVAIESNG